MELNSQVFILNRKNIVDTISTSKKEEGSDDFFAKGIYKPESNSVKTKDGFGLNGRFSVRSFSNYTSGISHAQNQYLRYSLSLNGKNVGAKDLEFQSSATYGYRTDTWNSSGNIWNNLKVYDFFFSYKPAESFTIQAGRIRNQNLYSLSTFDGVLFDYSFSKFTIGTFVGSHPDWQNMGVNIKLMQYGAFLCREDSLGKLRMSNNLSFANQTNSGKTDRRFSFTGHV